MTCFPSCLFFSLNPNDCARYVILFTSNHEAASMILRYCEPLFSTFAAGRRYLPLQLQDDTSRQRVAGYHRLLVHSSRSPGHVSGRVARISAVPH